MPREYMLEMNSRVKILKHEDDKVIGKTGEITKYMNEHYYVVASKKCAVWVHEDNLKEIKGKK